jgi:hypothetical protein
MTAEIIKTSDVAKKALEIMERRGIAYVLFLSDKTVVMDPNAEDIHEFPPTNQMEVYKLLIIRAPFTKMKDAVITIAKKPQREPFASFKGL